ncbi:MAG: hypothetical protein V7K32_04520 [Nostoc sp.]|uniref:hypothetical protein n=1 Tax=Nostoc sp. TaxID=1180 RepID=UPI002FF947C1
MSETSQLDVILRQLDTLSLVELLKIRTQIDGLIEEKSSLLSNILISENYRIATSVSNETRDINEGAMTNQFPALSSSVTKLDKYKFALQFSESEAKGDDSLEKVIGLVDEWMADECGYDEQTYPQIKTALNQSQLSL